MRLFYTVLFLGFFTFSDHAVYGVEEVYKRYPVESGIIEYTIRGDQTGHETVYFDQWGMREARYTQTTITKNESSSISNTVVLMDHDWITSFNPDRKTGSKVPNLWLQEIKASGRSGDLTATYQETLQSLGAVKSGTETFLEKDCDIWVNPSWGSTAWIWSSILLKIEYKTPALTIYIEAVSIQENATVEEEKFQIPSDVKIVEPAEAKEALDLVNR